MLKLLPRDQLEISYKTFASDIFSGSNKQGEVFHFEVFSNIQEWRTYAIQGSYSFVKVAEAQKVANLNVI